MIQYVDRIHGFFFGTTAELLAKTEEATANQCFVNTETGDIVVGPGKYAELAAAGKVDIRVRVATTTNVTIATALVGGENLEGVDLVDGDVVLLAGQTTASQNGTYVVGDTPARTSHAWNDIAGKLVHVAEGNNAGKTYRCISANGGTLGSTSMSFLAVANRELALSDSDLNTVLNNNTTMYDTDYMLVIDVTAGRGTLKAISCANVKGYMNS